MFQGPWVKVCSDNLKFILNLKGFPSVQDKPKPVMQVLGFFWALFHSWINTFFSPSDLFVSLVILECSSCSWRSCDLGRGLRSTFIREKWSVKRYECDHNFEFQIKCWSKFSELKVCLHSHHLLTHLFTLIYCSNCCLFCLDAEHSWKLLMCFRGCICYSKFCLRSDFLRLPWFLQPYSWFVWAWIFGTKCLQAVVFEAL